MKVISAAEYQKCGEIMFAAKKNKIAMRCNFCQQMFTQLQGFMRHLHIYHTDKIDFVKQLKEVEIYAVEELINHTAASPDAPDIENDESDMSKDDDWLNEEDVNWLDKGIEPVNNQVEIEESETVCYSKENVIVQSNKAEENDVLNLTNKEDNLNVTNISILKALEDCDVSVNFVNNVNSTKSTEDENISKLDTTLQQMQNCSDESDVSDSTPKSSDHELFHRCNLSLEEREVLETNGTITKHFSNNSFNVETSKKIEENMEQSPTKSIKNLILGLEDFDDVDIFPEDLKDNSENGTKFQDRNEMLYKNNTDAISFNGENNTEVLIDNNNLCEILPNFYQHYSKIEGKNKDISENSNSKIETKLLDSFEDCLQELENSVNNYVLKSSSISTKNIKTSENTNCEQNLRDLEKYSFMIDINNGDIITSNNSNKAIDTDFEKKFKNLNEDEVMIEKENKSSNLQNKSLNEDLTKALVDALNSEDLDLLNIHLDDSEEPLNENILDLLEHELEENETEKVTKLSAGEVKGEEDPLNDDIINVLKQELIEKDLLGQKQKIPELEENIHELEKKETENNIKLNLREEENEQTLNEDILSILERELLENHSPEQKHQIFDANSSSNNEKFITAFESEFKKINVENKKSEYQQTDFKSINKPTETLNKNKSNHLTKSILKESNSIINGDIKINKQIPLKQNQKQVMNIVKSLEKSPAECHVFDNSTQHKLVNSSQKTLSNKVNQENTNFNIQNIKTEKCTRGTNFINTERGNKTAIKRESFFKKSPKFQEKHKNLPQNTTAKCKETTTKKLKLQQSPEAQECQKSSNFKNNTKLDLPSETEDKRNKSLQSMKSSKTTPTGNFLVPKQDNNKSLLNSKLPTSSKASTDVYHLNYPLKNVAIRLQRCIPEKLAITNKKINNTTEQTSVRVNSSNQIKTEDNRCERIETPITTSTYNKQDFTKSTLKNRNVMEEKGQSHVKKQESLLVKSENTFPKRTNNRQIRQRVASIDIVTTAKEVAKQEFTSHKTPCHNNLDYKSYALRRSAQKKEVLQRMRNIKKQIFKSIEGSDSLDNLKNKQSPVITQKKPQNIIIESVEVLPSFNSNLFKKPLQNYFTTPTTAASQASRDLTEGHNSINKDEKGNKTLLKRQASSPLFDQNESAKRLHISSNHQKKREQISPELDKTQFDLLSGSCENFLQFDLKANRLNVESFLNSDMPEDEEGSTDEPHRIESRENDQLTECKTVEDEEASIINDLLEEINNENPAELTNQKGIAKNKTPTSNNSSFVKDFNAAKDIELLDKFGLTVIKLSDIEDDLFLEQRDEMEERARKFAGIYRKYQRIWSTKKCESQAFKDELDNDFKGLLNEAYLIFNAKLKIFEVKRLVNLINVWFAENIRSKFIEKRKISDLTNRFLSYFCFIPKTMKRFFYCEFCEECLTTEHKYYTHRMIHTGAIYPYVCEYCSFGFRIMKQLKNHESSCTKKNLKSANNPKLKCLICAEAFETSQLLLEHSKKHVKNKYLCAKCGSLFESALDVEMHIKLCKRPTRRVLKPDTPRQPKLKQNH